MTLFLPLGPFSPFDDIELRYALRSWEMYSNVTKLVIAGWHPGWMKPDEFIPMPDNRPKELNLHFKTMQMQGDFVYTNDDIFLLQPWRNLYYASGKLRDTRREGIYGLMVERTLKLFPNGWFYDVHTPMPVSNYQALPHRTEETLIKSSYLNTLDITPTLLEDCKINRNLQPEDIDRVLANRPCFSIGDAGLNSHMRQWLAKKYLVPSRWEME